MKYSLIVFLIVVSKLSNAQTIEEQKMFLRTISNNNEDNVIPYVTKNFDYEFEKVIKQNEIGLTNKNVKEIIRKYNNQQTKISFSKTDSLIFIALKQEEVHDYLKLKQIEKSNKRILLLNQKDTISLKKLDSNLFHYVYSFSIPVYYNENKSCIIESLEYCGGCGITKISIFTKINDRWELVTSEIVGEF